MKFDSFGCRFISALTFAAFFMSVHPVFAEPQEKIESTERCAVCGMFVAKYPNWVSQIRYADDSLKLFDGVKDLMAHYFHPASFGVDATLGVSEVWVKDYYSLKWIDGRLAYFVVGSDVNGPMGHEFVPFESRESAENFFKDHHGKEIVHFSDITAERVESMRMGHKMKKHKMDGKMAH